MAMMDDDGDDYFYDDYDDVVDDDDDDDDNFGGTCQPKTKGESLFTFDEQTLCPKSKKPLVIVSGDLALQRGLCEGVREEGGQADTITIRNTNTNTNTNANANANANAKVAKLEPMEGANKWKASLTITVDASTVMDF